MGKVGTEPSREHCWGKSVREGDNEPKPRQCQVPRMMEFSLGKTANEMLLAVPFSRNCLSEVVCVAGSPNTRTVRPSRPQGHQDYKRQDQAEHPWNHQCSKGLVWVSQENRRHASAELTQGSHQACSVTTGSQKCSRKCEVFNDSLLFF